MREVEDHPAVVTAGELPSDGGRYREIVPTKFRDVTGVESLSFHP